MIIGCGVSRRWSASVAEPKLNRTVTRLRPARWSLISLLISTMMALHCILSPHFMKGSGPEKIAEIILTDVQRNMS